MRWRAGVAAARGRRLLRRGAAAVVDGEEPPLYPLFGFDGEFDYTLRRPDGEPLYRYREGTNGDRPEDQDSPEPRRNGTRVRTTVVPERPEPPARDGQPRPVLPDWTRDPLPLLRLNVNRWSKHAAFHAVRMPGYLVLLMAYTPRGMWRSGIGLWRWYTDHESAPLRWQARERGDQQAWLVLAREQRHRTQQRKPAAWTLVAIVTVVVIVGLNMSPLIRAATLVALVVSFGLYGKPADKPLFEDPTIAVPGARRITANMLVRAFIDAKLCSEDQPIEFLAPGVERDGTGSRAVIDLPGAVTAEKAIGKSRELAAALRIDGVRLSMTEVRGDMGHAGRLNVWIAHADPFAGKPTQSPLVTAPRWDFWKALPFGTDVRGQLVTLPLVWSSLLIGAKPRVGKTFAARLVAAAAALDPLVRLIVFDGKGGRDWKAFEKVAYRCEAGIRDSVVQYLVRVLRELKEDMDRRYETIRGLSDLDSPEGKVTPALCARRDLAMPLTVLVIDEVQRYLEDDEHGATILALLTDIAKTGPAAGIMLVLATQKPDTGVMPDSLRGQVGTRFCLMVTTWQTSDMVLGSGSSKAGLDASKLRQSDLGVGILTATDDNELTDRGGQTIWTHFMDLPMLTKVCDRGRALRIGAETLEGVAAGDDLEEPIPDLFLEHVLDAFEGDEDRVWSGRLCGRMAKAHPELYDGWAPTDLANALLRYGITTKDKAGYDDDGERRTRKGPARTDVLAALADRVGA